MANNRSWGVRMTKCFPERRRDVRSCFPHGDFDLLLDVVRFAMERQRLQRRCCIVSTAFAHEVDQELKSGLLARCAQAAQYNQAQIRIVIRLPYVLEYIDGSGEPRGTERER